MIILFPSVITSKIGLKTAPAIIATIVPTITAKTTPVINISIIENKDIDNSRSLISHVIIFHLLYVYHDLFMIILFLMFFI